MYRLTKLLLLFVCLATGVSFGQAGSVSGQVVNQNGVPLPFALVRVCSATATGTPCNPPTPIYYDYGLTNQAPNPFTSDQYGNYTIFVPALPAPNLYTVQFSPNSGLTWQYVRNGPVNGAPAIQACNQPGATAAAQINAAGVKLPAGGGVIDATCYGATVQVVDQQVTALASPAKPTQLLLNPATTFDVTTVFSPTLIAQNVTTGISGASGACDVPIGNGSSVVTPGWNQSSRTPYPYWILQKGSATYDVFCSGAMDGTQESFVISGLGVIGAADATVSGALLHLRQVYVSTLVENMVTYAPYGNAVQVDGGSDNLFINDDFNDSQPGGGYVGAVMTLNCVADFTMLGGAIQFNGANNPLLLINGSYSKLSICPLGSSTRGVRLYNVDIETSPATVGTFPGAATNVDPIQITDSGFILIDNMVIYGGIGAGQNHVVDLLSSGNNGQLRGPVEINNISAPTANFTGKSIIHNENGPLYVTPALADVYGTQNDSELTIGQYKWEGSGANQASSIDYEDFKDFSSVASGVVNTVINAARQPGADIGAKINSAFAACSSQCTVYVPAGTYTYGTSVVIPMNLLGQSLLDMDAGASLTYSGTGCAITTAINTSSPTVVNLRIHGGQIFGGSNSPQCGIHVMASNGVWIDRVVVVGFTAGDGIWIDGSNSDWITNSLINGNQVGVYATNTLCNGSACSPTQPGGSVFTPNAIHIVDNDITGNQQWGILFHDAFTNASTGALGNSVENNDLELNGVAGGAAYGALSVGMSTGMVISRNYFEGSPREIVLGFPGSPGTAFASNGPVIRDNYVTISSGTPYFLELQDTQNALIEGNSTLVQSQNSSNCFINETEATGTWYSKNSVILTGGGNLFCSGGTPETQMSSPTSFTFFNPGYQAVLADQNFQITTTVTSETIPLQYLTTNGSCYLQVPDGNTTAIQNARASYLAGTSYLSVLAAGSVTLTHPTGNAMTFDVWCAYRATGGYGP